MGLDARTPSNASSERGPLPTAVPAPLLRRFREAAEETGFLPFDRFMEISLYDRGSGFYARDEPRFGRRGDYYTASHVHALFGSTIAAHLREIRREEGFPPRFPIVEVGAGDGTLANDIRTALGSHERPEEAWEYLVVERSAARRAEIESRLGPPGTGAVPWRFALSIASEGPFRGVVLANELLDACPFRRYQSTETGWRELGVLLRTDGSFELAARPLESGALPPGLPADVAPGSVVEVSQWAEAWVRELADHMVGGRILLIDYGGDEELLTTRGGAGTLEAIRAHGSVDPLVAPGTADLSAWVNFTRIRRAALRAGLHEESYAPLAESLVHWGIEGVRTSMEAGLDAAEKVKLQLAQKSFLMGFGPFKVLELSPTVASSKRRGESFLDSDGFYNVTVEQ